MHCLPGWRKPGFVTVEASALDKATLRRWQALRWLLFIVCVLAIAASAFLIVRERSSTAITNVIAALEEQGRTTSHSREGSMDFVDFSSPQGYRRLNEQTLPNALLRSRSPVTNPVNKPDVNVLFLSKSKPTNYNRRHLSRAGWQTKARQDSSCWCALESEVLCSDANQVCQHGRLIWAHRFVVGGLALDDHVRQRIHSELASFFDIVLYPQVDTYRRLTWKVLWILNYVSHQVSFDYVMLLDDDCFVQIWRVSDFLVPAPRTKLYAGHVEENQASVSRSSWNRWQVSHLAYNGTHFPPYAWGAGLILSMDVARLTVLEAARWKHPWFGVDDAFMGVVLNSSGIPPTNIEGIYTGGMYKSLGCRGNYLLREAQPLVVAASEAETISLILAQTQGRSLCTVLDGPLRLLLLLVVSPHFPLLVLLALASSLLLGLCWWQSSLIYSKLNIVR